jgi:hypothetical protein
MRPAVTKLRLTFVKGPVLPGIQLPPLLVGLDPSGTAPISRDG